MSYLNPLNSFNRNKRYIPYKNKIYKTSIASRAGLTYTLPKSFYSVYRREKHLIYKTRERLFNSTVNRQVGVIGYMLDSKYYAYSNCKEFGCE
jgi:hypothetical protein